MAKRKTLLDKVREISPVKQHWIKSLSVEVQQDLLDVRASYHKGELRGRSQQKIYERLVDSLGGLPVGLDAFNRWLRAKS